jgi:hypothetical protein
MNLAAGEKANDAHGARVFRKSRLGKRKTGSARRLGPTRCGLSDFTSTHRLVGRGALN